MFELVDNFFIENGLQWSKLVGCTTDGALAMLGRKSGFQASVKAVFPVISVHSFIHRFAHAAEHLFPNLKTSLNLVVKMVNYIKTSALNGRLFKAIRENIESEYLLLFYTNVRWLSRGNTAMRRFVMRKELPQFFRTKDNEYHKILKDQNFILYLACLSDIFEVMNHFNRYLQEPESNIIDFSAKLTAFVRKLNLWIKNIENRQFGMSENVASLAWEPSITFVQEIIKHLLLKDEIKHYFFNDGDAQACAYTLNPFTANLFDLPVGTGEQEELIDLQCDEGAQEKLKEFTSANFLLSDISEKCNYSASRISNIMGMRTAFSTFLSIK